MKYLAFTVIIVQSLFSFGQTQAYKTVVGIKGGFPGYGSVNIKHNLGGTKYIEASLGGLGRRNYGNGFYLLGDLEINNHLSHGFLWHYGAGALVGFSANQISNNFYFAPNAIAGLEYVFEDLPLNISIDTGPYLFISPQFDFVWGGGFALRYVVN